MEAKHGGFCSDNDAAASCVGERGHIFCELSLCVVADQQLWLGLRIGVLPLELSDELLKFAGLDDRSDIRESQWHGIPGYYC